MEFEFDERGYLIVDGVYTDPRYPQMEIIKIGDNYYRLAAARLMDDGQDLAEHLTIMPAYCPPTTLEPRTMEMAIMSLKCAYRNVPKSRLNIGRAITNEELEGLIKRHNLSGDDISESANVTIKAIYGAKHAKTISVRYIQVTTDDVISVESKLKLRGIYAYAAAPKTLAVRVE